MKQFVNIIVNNTITLSITQFILYNIIHFSYKPFPHCKSNCSTAVSVKVKLTLYHPESSNKFQVKLDKTL